jgi:hypothetical protein
MLQWRRYRGLALLAATAIALSGCAHQAPVSITSNRLNAYQPNIQRLLVITDLGQVMRIQRGDEEALFESAVEDSLGGCGIVVKFHRHDPLSLENEAQGAIGEFHPDTILTLQLRSGTTYGAIPTSFHSEGSIVDLRSKREVWKAGIDSAPGFNAGQNLASTLIDNLKKSTILGPACATPTIPKL